MIAAEIEREERRSEVRSAACGFPTVIDAETQHGIEQYLFREAALLDDRNWEAWESSSPTMACIGCRWPMIRLIRSTMRRCFTKMP